MISEKDMEDQIAADPEHFLGEPDLVLVARQFAIGSYRFDLLFRDRHGGKLIVEIQKGTLDRNHTYKILDYYHELRDREPAEFIDVMIVANQITAERKKRLRDHGIAYREIPESQFAIGGTVPTAPIVSTGQVVAQGPTTPAIAGERSANDASREGGFHFRSLGPSAFIESARRAIAGLKESVRWSLGGKKGSLTVIHSLATQRINSPERRGLVAQMWMDRPSRGVGKCTFEIAYGPPGQRAFRERIAQSVRGHLASLDLPSGTSLSGGSTVVRCKLGLPSIQSISDDTPENAARYTGEIDRVVEFFRHLDAALPVWAGNWSTDIRAHDSDCDG